MSEIRDLRLESYGPDGFGGSLQDFQESLELKNAKNGYANSNKRHIQTQMTMQNAVAFVLGNPDSWCFRCVCYLTSGSSHAQLSTFV